MNEYPHNDGDCHGTRCDYCGCCMHATSPCKVTDLPAGIECPNRSCGCEGRA